MKVAVILPSRGLIFSQTANEIIDNVKGIPHKFFFSHGKPIPQCFEEPTERALREPDITHIWFVEEDMVLPPDTLRQMLEADANAITCDYPVTKAGHGSVFRDQGGHIVFCGTGCLLVRRDIFSSLNKPFFTDKVRWTMLNYGEAVKFTGMYADTGYGTHDITFCVKLWNTGVTIQSLDTKLGQRKLISLGKTGSNNGAHKVEVWKKIKKDLRLRSIQAEPVAPAAKSKLVTVDTPTGGITTTRKHADNLVEQGLANYPPRRFTIIDDSQVEI